MKFYFCTVIAAMFLCGCSIFSAPDMADKFTVHKTYTDHMVLQCRRPVVIGGKAQPGKAVKVSIGKNTVTAIADPDGFWRAELPAMEPGGPWQVSVTGKKETVVFNDVLIGEVWLCTGQSNMQMPVYTRSPYWRVANYQQELESAKKYPRIRIYNQASFRYCSPGREQEEVKGPGWQVCSPEHISNFSALAFSFGKKLYDDLNVPIGLIHCSWGATPIESWLSRAGLEAGKRTQELMIIEAAASPEKREKVRKAIESANEKAFQEWLKRFVGDYTAETAAARHWKDPGLDDSSWSVRELPAFFSEDCDGVIWYRKEIEIPAAWAGKELEMKFGIIDDCDETYFNGVKVGETGVDIPQYWLVRRCYTVPAKLVKAGKAVIALRVTDMFSDGGVPGPILSIGIRGSKHDILPLNGPWKAKFEYMADMNRIGSRPLAAGALPREDKQDFPGTCFNALVAPWTRYPVQGILWYQGENNATAYEDYMKLQPLLIADWRKRWNDPELAFVYVQLAPFEAHRPTNRLPDDFWKKQPISDPALAKMREVQEASLNVYRTGMAVSIDVGDHSDIHPANKQTIAYRLACEAERLCYGRKEISAGPYYERMNIEGNKIRLYFRNSGSGLMAKGGVLNGFVIAGADRVFYHARAEISGDTVIVYAPEVPAPRIVRYGWARYPGGANLYNREGFPASPFRSDRPHYLLKK